MPILLLIGTVLILWAALSARVYYKAKRWEKTKGILIEIAEGEFKELNMYAPPTEFAYPKARYEYSVGDKKYANDAVTFERRNYFKYKGDKSEFWDAWKAGDEVDVFYNPKNPSESILIPYMSKKRRSHYIAIFISGLLLIAAGFIINSA